MELTYENLKSAIQRLLSMNGQMIDLASTAIPHNCFRIRYMKTAGGMQLCLKEVDRRGEGSGIYFPIEEIDKLCEFSMRMYHRRDEGTKKFTGRLKTLSETSKARLTEIVQAKWEIHFRADETYRNLDLEAAAREWADEIGGEVIVLENFDNLNK